MPLHPTPSSPHLSWPHPTPIPHRSIHVADRRIAGRPPAADSGAVDELLVWFRANGRDLPWRQPPRLAWPTLVSEVMLQQTQVDRVIPHWQEWMRRWPRPADLATADPAEALRLWGGLGYPRRGLRLHQSAQMIVADFQGDVPDDVDGLRSLPGVGAYTAAAVLAFSYRQRAAVLDTNVRRVIARHDAGLAQPSGTSATRAEEQRLLQLLPGDREQAAQFSEGLMELGAVVCGARSPRCGDCPVAEGCKWLAAGRPPVEASARRRQQPFAGSNRQVRGRILNLARQASQPLPQAAIDVTWPDPEQRRKAQDSLIEDGLLIEVRPGEFSLPATS